MSGKPQQMLQQEQPVQLEQAEGKSQVIAMAAENSQVDDEHELSDCANLSGKEQ